LEAGHPIPDVDSVKAGRAVHDLVSRAGDRDLVICLLSGGASALMELPREGLSLADLQETTNLLLRSGATINDLNAVRACLSRLKAGGLARAAHPARAFCLVISDVLGNHLDVIGSGPCYNVELDPGRAREVLDRFGLWDRVPESIRRMLHSSQSAAKPREPFAQSDHVILGDIATAIVAGANSAIKYGLTTYIGKNDLQGEARDVGREYGRIARDLPQTRITCHIAGGETTVTVRGKGTGGRSQELATAAALELAGVPDVALLAAGTDGTDGPTEVAGGVIDGQSVERAAANGISAELTLAENNTFSFLRAADAHVMTGPTQTNVGDLLIIVYRPEPASDPQQGLLHPRFPRIGGLGRR
jgi:hydroxypyruvate reductase